MGCVMSKDHEKSQHMETSGGSLQVQQEEEDHPGESDTKVTIFVSPPTESTNAKSTLEASTTDCNTPIEGKKRESLQLATFSVMPVADVSINIPSSTNMTMMPAVSSSTARPAPNQPLTSTNRSSRLSTATSEEDTGGWVF